MRTVMALTEPRPAEAAPSREVSPGSDVPRVDNIGFSEIVIEHFGRAGLLAEGFGGR